MSEALNDTLVQIRLRIERGLLLAEQELQDTRERCARLELVIRSMRAQRSELAVLDRPDLARALDTPAAETVVTIPEAASPERPAVPETPAASRPVVVSAPAAKAEPAVASEPAAVPEPVLETEHDEVTEIPTNYMPMLEELWDIARRADTDEAGGS